MLDTVSHSEIATGDLIFTLIADAQSKLQMRRASDLSLVAEVTELHDRADVSRGYLKEPHAICVDDQYLWIAGEKAATTDAQVTRLNWSDLTYDDKWEPTDASAAVPSALAADRVSIFRAYLAGTYVAANTRGKPYRLRYHDDTIKAKAIAVGSDVVYAIEFDGVSADYLVVRNRTDLSLVTQVALPTGFDGLGIAIDGNRVYVCGYDGADPALLIYQRDRLLIDGDTTVYENFVLSWTIDGTVVTMSIPQSIAVNGNYIYVSGVGTIGPGNFCNLLVQLYGYQVDTNKVGDPKAYVELDPRDAGSCFVACLPPMYLTELPNDAQIIEATISVGLSMAGEGKSIPKLAPSLGVGLSLASRFKDGMKRLVSDPYFGIGFTLRAIFHDLFDHTPHFGFGIRGSVRLLSMFIRKKFGLGFAISARLLTSRTGYPILVLMHDTDSICPVPLSLYHEDGGTEPAQLPQLPEDGIYPAENPNEMGPFDGGTLDE